MLWTAAVLAEETDKNHETNLISPQPHRVLWWGLDKKRQALRNAQFCKTLASILQCQAGCISLRGTAHYSKWSQNIVLHWRSWNVGHAYANCLMWTKRFDFFSLVDTPAGWRLTCIVLLLDQKVFTSHHPKQVFARGVVNIRVISIELCFSFEWFQWSYYRNNRGPSQKKCPLYIMVINKKYYKGAKYKLKVQVLLLSLTANTLCRSNLFNILLLLLFALLLDLFIYLCI